jgi:hypothetical protein
MALPALVIRLPKVHQRDLTARARRSRGDLERFCVLQTLRIIAAVEAPKEPPEPRLVTRVVCAYRLGVLPGDWLQTWRRLDRLFARAHLKVKATLAPLEELPKDTGIVVVPPDLREAAREYAPPGTPILVTSAASAAGAFAELVSKLEAGTELTAEKLDAEAQQGPKIVSYTGYTRND